MRNSSKWQSSFTPILPAAAKIWSIWSYKIYWCYSQNKCENCLPKLCFDSSVAQWTAPAKYHLDFSDSEIPPYILQIRDQLEEDFRQGITLESLEERYHINKYQIVKEFSKYMGTPSSNRLANASLIRKTFCAILGFPSKRSHWRSASKTPPISAVYSRKSRHFTSDYRQTENGR